jgi:radical SAM superfamily enzyme YgiQ (UPF0313 family)
MAMVSSALSAQGHEVRQLDLLVEGETEDRLNKIISEFDPDFFCISIRNIDNVDSLSPESAWTLSKDKALVDQIRLISSAPIIIGGSAFSMIPEAILDFVGGDYGITGEGERTVCDLIDVLNDGGSSPRIINSNNTPLSGNEMNAPLWDKSLIDYYVEQSGIMNLQTKRGCPYHCIYCTYPYLEGRRLRLRDPKAVVNDIEELQREYGVDTIFFTDSVFNDSEGNYLQVADALISSGLKIQWAGYFRPQGIGSKELAVLKRSGLYAMEVGTDAGCDETLDRLGKGFCFDEVFAFNEACLEHEIPSAHFFIFGGPGETEDTLKKGLSNIGKLRKTVIFVYSGIRILPGAKLCSLAVKEGLIEEGASLLKPVYYFSPQVNVTAMNETIEKFFDGHREYIFPPYKAQMVTETMNLFGHKGLLWDRLIPFKPQKRRRRRNNRE